MTAPSPEGDVKIASPIITFVLNTLSLKLSAFFSHVSPVAKQEDELGLLQFV